eukprot:Amastigsp_a842977_13.p3 type:complete len:147 gc:universal Amastigsp_a842977_13:485-925(+)
MPALPSAARGPLLRLRQLRLAIRPSLPVAGELRGAEQLPRVPGVHRDHAVLVHVLGRACGAPHPIAKRRQGDAQCNCREPLRCSLHCIRCCCCDHALRAHGVPLQPRLQRSNNPRATQVHPRAAVRSRDRAQLWPCVLPPTDPLGA